MKPRIPILFAAVIFPILISRAEPGGRETLAALLNAEGITPENNLKEYEAYYEKILIEAGEKTAGEEEPYDKHEALFQLFHEKYLRKYVEEAYLTNLFKKGEFNCVTAVSLYYLVCSDLGLNINIYESPYHIYITAKKSSGKEFTIELTDPVKGFDADIDDNREDLLEFFLKQKLVTQDEIDEKGSEQVFKDLISESHLVTKEGLISIYYGNLSAYKLDKKDLYNAYKLIKKAVLINPDSIRIDHHNIIWESLVEEIESDTDSLSSFLIETIDSIPPSEEFRKSLIRASATAINNNLVIDNVNQADAVYNRLCSILPVKEQSSGAVQRSDIMIRSEKIRRDILRGNAASAFNTACGLFNKYKNNENALSIYISAGFVYLEDSRKSEDYNKMMEAADSLFANAFNIKSARELYINALGLFVLCSKDTVKIIEEKEKLLEKYKDNPGDKGLNKGLGFVYHGLAMAEIRKRNYKGAVELLNTGIGYDPDNSQLRNELYLTKDLVKKKAR